MEFLGTKNKRILRGFVEGKKDISNNNSKYARERIGVFDTPEIKKQLLGMKKSLKEFKKYIGMAVSNVANNKGGFKPFELEFENMKGNGGGMNMNNPAVGHIGNVELKYAAPVDGGQGHLVIMDDSPNLNTILSKFYEEYARYFSDVLDVKKDAKPIKLTYEKIRVNKAIAEKKKEKDAFKGLNMSTILTVIIYCQFIVDKNPLPIPILLKIMNDGLKRAKISKSLKIVTLKQFMDFKHKKLMKYVKKMAPVCYANSVSPSSFIGRFARMLRVDEATIIESRKLANKIEKEDVFGNGIGIDNGVIAMVCVIVKMKEKGYETSMDDFFIGPHLLAKGTVESVYKKILTILPEDHGLPAKPF